MCESGYEGLDRDQMMKEYPFEYQAAITGLTKVFQAGGDFYTNPFSQGMVYDTYRQLVNNLGVSFDTGLDILMAASEDVRVIERGRSTLRALSPLDFHDFDS